MDQIVALIESRRFAELEHRSRESIREQPSSGMLWKALGVALRLQGKDALEALATAARLLPQDAESQTNLGHAFLDAGRTLDAQASYRLALQIDPGLAEVHNSLGYALRMLGRLEEAAASYRRALEINPAYAEACIGLGNVYLFMRRSDEAIASYGRALEIRPGFAAAHGNLGNALRAAGRYEQAATSYRHAISLDPAYAGAYSHLSDVLRELGQTADAVASSRRALKIQPDLAMAHNSLGNALLDLGRTAEAADSYRRAAALDPASSQARINLGMVLRLEGRTAEAEASCREALAIDADAAAAVVLLAELLADQGRFAQAEESFKRAVALDPQLPEALAGIAHLRKMTPRDAAWLAEAQRLAQRCVSPRGEVYLRFALGKYFDDVGEYPAAFASFRRANELAKSYGPPYDRERATRTVDRLIRSHPPRAAAAAAASAGAIPASRPMFIVGMPRSGTTLAEQILASHPAVFGAGELPLWRTVGAAQEASSSADAAADSPVTLGGDYLRLLEALAPQATRVVDKMPANFLSLGVILEALPGARVIHMRRNPVDTCLSIYFQHFKSGHSYANDLGDLAHYYTQYLRLMDHWRAALPAHCLLEVPYEGLVADPEAWSRKMLAFIELPWDAKCLDFHQNSRSVLTASKWQVRQKISRSSVDRWRHYEPFIGPLRQLLDPPLA